MHDIDIRAGLRDIREDVSPRAGRIRAHTGGHSPERDQGHRKRAAKKNGGASRSHVRVRLEKLCLRACDESENASYRDGVCVRL